MSSPRVSLSSHRHVLLSLPLAPLNFAVTQIVEEGSEGLNLVDRPGTRRQGR